MTRNTFISAALMVGILALAGCEDLDPYRRTDVWYPTGAPQGNLDAMVANPQDLIHGHGVGTSDGKQSVTAIGHVWTDTPKAMLDPTGSAGSGGGGGGGGGGGATPGGAAPTGG